MWELRLELLLRRVQLVIAHAKLAVVEFILERIKS